MAEPLRARVDLERPDGAQVARAARLLLEGELVAAPSDTVYGLLALPRSESARAALAGIKGRPGPFIVLVSSWEQARSWTRGVDTSLWARLARVWPGPVTAILPTAPEMPGAEKGGIGLRMPQSRFLTALLTAVGEPLFSTSANLPGQAPPLEAGDIDAAVAARCALVLDGGRADSREPSTLVDFLGESPIVRRRGRGDPAPLLDPAKPGS